MSFPYLKMHLCGEDSSLTIVCRNFRYCDRYKNFFWVPKISRTSSFSSIRKWLFTTRLLWKKIFNWWMIFLPVKTFKVELLVNNDCISEFLNINLVSKFKSTTFTWCFTTFLDLVTGIFDYCTVSNVFKNWKLLAHCNSGSRNVWKLQRNQKKIEYEFVRYTIIWGSSCSYCMRSEDD